MTKSHLRCDPCYTLHFTQFVCTGSSIGHPRDTTNNTVGQPYNVGLPRVDVQTLQSIPVPTIQYPPLSITKTPLHPKLRNIQHANSYYDLQNCRKVSSKTWLLGRTLTCKKGMKTLHLHKMCKADVVWLAVVVRHPCHDCRKMIGCRGRNSKSR